MKVAGGVLNSDLTGHSNAFISRAFTRIIIIDFSLTVKATTLIFISGRCSAISSAKAGKSGSIYNLVKLSRVNVRAFHESPNRVNTELTFINP